MSRGTFDTLPLQEWDDVLRTNVTGAFLCARAVLPAMRMAKWGRIVHISSSAVLLGRPNFLHYFTSKAALIGMTRAMARELGPDGITVKSILPGLTKTEIDAAGATEQVWQTIIDRQCIKRSEVPDDIASVLLFLASSASGFHYRAVDRCRWWSSPLVERADMLNSTIRQFDSIFPAGRPKFPAKAEKFPAPLSREFAKNSCDYRSIPRANRSTRIAFRENSLQIPCLSGNSAPEQSSILTAHTAKLTDEQFAARRRKFPASFG